ncbi:UDP-glucose 4-epimerase [Wickerhamomyces ciferrii]|uniref:UDP-glucose 4-epimerase n=1 Tax=Wickerhamomyces ciferrii (strain ATCC 14091 / BCRC 22168 / CBS 111 / JCM 3599 / NBRC 0793 / NRRL Y-1031 F-60-10) TaxID=1206466 RepID=K0KI62_WICCF|nr:UDP-glucose 4-epimerase [Wickerhamomyces ciferrii]CCH41094.1 UDP-glucose 4-epimerase [Wickerhamomyces ciferrii]
MSKVFITGATGFIGSIVVDELLSHGYKILGLARSDKSAEQLTKKGVEVLKGDLENFDSIKEGVSKSDGVIHLGFIHDFSNMAHSYDIDFQVSQVIVDAIKGTSKFFIYTSGLGGFGSDIGVKTFENTEIDADSINPFFRTRFLTETFVAEAASKNQIRTIVLRLPHSVHDKGDSGFVPHLIQFAQKNGVSYYVGEGKGKWPAVHRYDAAVAFRLAVEKGQAGKSYHIVHEEGVETKKIAEAIGNKTGLKTESLGYDQLESKLGFLGYFLASNVEVSSEITQKELGWTPKQIGLLEDISRNY